MLRLSDFYKSKELWSVGCGSTGCDARNEWSFGVPIEDWYVKVPGINWRSFGLTVYVSKQHKIIEKGIIWQYENISQ